MTDPTGGRWPGGVRAYAASFAHLCAGAVEPVLATVGVGPSTAAGRSLLDAGAGTGSLARVAVSYGAAVTAVDADPSMLAAARGNVPAARCVQADLAGLPFRDDCFEAVAANFVVNHVDDARAVIRELGRVTAPGGTFAVTIWPAGTSAMNRLWADVIAASRAVVPPPDHLPAGPDFPRTVDGLHALVAIAGLVQVKVKTLEWELRIAPDQLWQGPAGGVAGIGKVVTAQPPVVRRRMKHAYDQLVQPLLDGDQLVLPARALLGAATKPAS